MKPDQIKLTARVASAGALLTNNQKEANEFKVRILKAGLGQYLMLPADWDELPEDEKTRRLDKVIELGLQDL